mgnify:CR=1 FL=1
MDNSKIVKRTKKTLSPWVAIYEDEVKSNGRTEVYHSILVPDYVCVLAIDNEGYVPLVKQFRHAINEITLELPAGLCENNISPKEAALKELLEETGYKSESEAKKLISLRPCTGRLSNKGWCFFLNNIEKQKDWIPESNVELVMTKSSNLKNLVNNGDIQNGMHIATILKAINEGLI